MDSFGAAEAVGLGDGGRRLWAEVLGRYELDEHELALLLQAARTVDTLDDLAVVAASEGPMVDRGLDRVVHPALVEARQQRLVLARLVASLRLPEEPVEGRPQRRGGARGAYGVRGVAL